jgi:hypothetical protein
MLKRILLAGLLAGIVMFLWEGLAHEALPLGEAGIKALPNEAAFMTTVKDVKESGLYFFPAPEDRPGMSSGEKKKALEAVMQKWKIGPGGIMVLQAGGMDADSPKQLITQCLTDILLMLVAALMLSRATLLSSYMARVGFVTMLALFPILNADLPYWNWYGFPVVYTLAQFVIRVVGFLVGGLVVAKFIKAGPQ